MQHQASACCTIRRLPRPTFCRERCRLQSSSSSSRRKAGTVISTNFLPSRPAYEICARCRQKRKKQLGEIEKRVPRFRINGGGRGLFPGRRSLLCREDWMFFLLPWADPPPCLT